MNVGSSKVFQRPDGMSPENVKSTEEGCDDCSTYKEGIERIYTTAETFWKIVMATIETKSMLTYKHIKLSD